MPDTDTEADEQPLDTLTAIGHDVFGVVSLRDLAHMIEETGTAAISTLASSDGRTGN